MTITVSVSSEVQRELSLQAERQGLSAEEYASRIVEERVAPKQSGKRILKGYGSAAHLDVTVDSYLAHKAENRGLEGIE